LIEHKTADAPTEDLVGASFVIPGARTMLV